MSNLPNGLEWWELPEADSTEAQDGTRETTRVIELIWQKPGLRAANIRSLSICPRPFDPHPEDPFALARAPRITSNNRFYWRITTPYSTALDAPKEDDNPLARPPNIKFRARGRTAPYVRDSAGLPVTNTAGDLLLGANREFHDYLISVQKFVAAVPSWLEDYQDAVNSDDVRILGRTFKKGKLLFVLESIDSIDDPKRFYFDLRFQLVHSRDGHSQIFPNVGRRELVAGLTGDALAALPKDEQAAAALPKLVDVLVGNPPRVTSEPVWLDKDGKAIRDAAGNIKTKLLPAELLFVERKPHFAMPFTRLPIR